MEGDMTSDCSKSQRLAYILRSPPRQILATKVSRSYTLTASYLRNGVNIIQSPKKTREIIVVSLVNVLPMSM